MEAARAEPLSAERHAAHLAKEKKAHLSHGKVLLNRFHCVTTHHQEKELAVSHQFIRGTLPVLGLQVQLHQQLHQPPSQEITLAEDTDDGRTKNDLANQHEAHQAIRVAHKQQ